MRVNWKQNVKNTPRNPSFRFLALLLALSPVLLLGQKRDDILSIQRDVAQLQDQVKQLQAGQDQKLGTLESLIKQALEESNKVSTASAELQRTLTERLNQQQAQVEAPIVVLGTKVDQSAEELRAVHENLADLSRRLANLDNKLADISSAVRTLSTPPAAPPPAPGSDSPASTAPAPPPGVTAEGLWQKAVRDYTGAKDKLALGAFADFLKYFPHNANAAEAQYYMGLIYDHGEQYDDAAQVFQAVTERYPDSPKAADAMYMKGVEYQKAGSDKEAIAAYRAFVKQHPGHPNVPKAQARLRALVAGTSAKSAKKRK
jgi:TolA-binding protein